MRVSLLLLAILFAAAGRVGAQDLESPYGHVAISPGDKGRALVAALQFSTALSADSVGVAGCTAEKAVGEADYRAVVQPALGARLLQPAAAAEGDPSMRCAVWNFQQDGQVRLYIEDLVQIRRESNRVLPYPERVAFELNVQVLHGRGYREWHRMTVRPERVSQPTDGGAHTVGSWRVIRYEVIGWQWMHEHSSSSGPIR